MPQVDLKILTRPMQTRAYVKTFADVMGYQHIKTAQGGDDSASCQLLLPYGLAREFIDAYLGCRVEFNVNNPEMPISQGFINRITLESGALVQTRSLDEMYNRVTVTYDVNGTGTAQQPVTNNTASQDKYGVKVGSIDGGVNFHSSNVSLKRELRNLILAVKSWPGTSTVYSGRPAETGVIKIEVKGIQYFAFDWVEYNDTASTTLADPNVWLTGTILPLSTNTNAPRVVSTSDTTLIQSNAAFSQVLKDMSGMSIWQQMLNIVEAGSGTARWVIGVTPYDRHAGYHRLYYRPARTSINYLMFTGRDYQVFDINGKPIKPWELQPDYGMRIVDDFAPPTLQSVNIGEGDNPNVLYLKTVRYDADSNIATWQSDDDMTTEGALQLGAINKVINRKGGAPSRRTRL